MPWILLGACRCIRADFSGLLQFPVNQDEDADDADGEAVQRRAAKARPCSQSSSGGCSSAKTSTPARASTRKHARAGVCACVCVCERERERERERANEHRGQLLCPQPWRKKERTSKRWTGTLRLLCTKHPDYDDFQLQLQ